MRDYDDAGIVQYFDYGYMQTKHIHTHTQVKLGKSK